MSRNIVAVLALGITLVSAASAQTVYYVSSSTGDDNNSGLSPDSAWQTVNKVNYHPFADGDTVCFKRGDTFSDKSLVVYNIPDNLS